VYTSLIPGVAQDSLQLAVLDYACMDMFEWPVPTHSPRLGASTRTHESPSVPSLGNATLTVYLCLLLNVFSRAVHRRLLVAVSQAEPSIGVASACVHAVLLTVRATGHHLLLMPSLSPDLSLSLCPSSMNPTVGDLPVGLGSGGE
jgi:hypothetical protein